MVRGSWIIDTCADLSSISNTEVLRRKGNYHSHIKEHGYVDFEEMPGRDQQCEDGTLVIRTDGLITFACGGVSSDLHVAQASE